MPVGAMDPKKQISKMDKGKKVTKKVVGSANGRAARGEAEDGTGEDFAADGMGLGPLSAVAAGGSGEESTSADQHAPPAFSMLDDAVPQPAGVDPSPVGGAAGGETVTAVLTLKQ